jgi:hypothetical protein
VTRFYVAILMALAFPSLATADAAVPDPLFASDDVFSITLTGPLAAIAADHDDEPEVRPAELSVVGADGVQHTIAIGLKPRGHSRRRPNACDFPPLRLEFPKSGTEGTLFAGQKKLKLVTQCHKRDTSQRYEQYILKEYVLYHVFNRLSPLSFRNRLVQVTYVDAGSKNAPVTSYGFFIEDKSRLAARTGLRLADVKQIERASLDPIQTDRVELFEFMIGNTDFSLLRGPADDPCCHNVVPLIGDDGKFLPVPYDFDSTGVVDPPYALPAEQLKIKNVRQRVYRGKCPSEAAFNQVLEEFKAARADINALFGQQAGLQPQTVKTVTSYIDDFYAIIDDPKQLDDQILRICRK